MIMMKKLTTLLAALLMAFGLAIGGAGTASASHPGTGPVQISHGFKWTPNPGAFTWFGALPNWCTLTAVGNDSADRLIAITAGHCVANQNPGAPIYAYNNNLPAPINQPIGTLRSKNVTSTSGPSRYDYAVIELDASRVTMHRNAVAGVAASTVDAVGVPAVGQAVHKIGATSGRSDGTVTTVDVPNGDVITTTMNATGGDSGAPLITTGANDVIGILRGPQQACPFICPVTGTLYKNLPDQLANIPAGQPGAGFTVTVNP
jgi:hypothetical protein